MQQERFRVPLTAVSNPIICLQFPVLKPSPAVQLGLDVPVLWLIISQFLSFHRLVISTHLPDEHHFSWWTRMHEPSRGYFHTKIG